MADTTIQTSFAFTCSNAEMALIEEAVLAAANLTDDFEPDQPNPELLAVLPPVNDDVWSGVRNLFTDADFPSFGADIEGGNSIERSDRSVVHVFGTTDFEPNTVAFADPALLRRKSRTGADRLRVLLDLLEPRVGELGGGWCVIHPDRIDSGTTGEALAAALRA